MSTLTDVALIIEECANGANGEMSDGDIANRAAMDLVDVVHEWVDGLTFEQQRAVRRMMAFAMLRQHQHTSASYVEALSGALKRDKARKLDMSGWPDDARKKIWVHPDRRDANYDGPDDPRPPSPET